MLARSTSFHPQPALRHPSPFAALAGLALLLFGACSNEPEPVATGFAPQAQGRPVLALLAKLEDVQRSATSALIDVDLSGAPAELPAGWLRIKADERSTVIGFAIETSGGELTLDVDVAQGGLRLAAICAPLESELIPEGDAERLEWIKRYEDAPMRRDVIIAPGAPKPPVADLPERNDADSPPASGRVLLLAEFLKPDARIAHLSLSRKARFAVQYQSRVLTLPDMSFGPAIGRVGIAGDEREALVLPVGVTRTIRIDPTELQGRNKLHLGLGAVIVGPPNEMGEVALDVTLSNANGPLLEKHFALNPVQMVRARHWIESLLQLPSDLGAGPLELSLTASGSRVDAAVAVAGLHMTGGRALKARPNVFLISLDTLRRDRLGKAGKQGSLTQNLDAFESQALVFDGALAVAPFTLPTHATVFSGRLPTEHGGVGFQTPIAKRTPMLAERARAAGWLTAAFTGGGFLAPEFGFARGFDRYTVHDPLITIETLPVLVVKSPADLLAMTELDWANHLRLESAHGLKLRAVKEWLETYSDTPQFVFLHTYAAHQYQPPKRIYMQELYDTPSQLTMRPAIGELDDARFRREPPSSADVTHMRRLYDACVRHADESLGAFLAYLDETGLAETSYVVIFSDHGEQLFEHDQFGHSNHVWDTLLGVPLMIRGPGITPDRISDPVSLLDLGPTLAELLGLAPDPDSLGRSLLMPRKPGGWQVSGHVASSQAGVFSEVSRGMAYYDSIVQGAYKLIRRYRKDGTFSDALYNLEADPGEVTDVAASHPEQVAALAARLDAWRQLVNARAAGESGDAQLAESTLQQLRDLGYF